jgi:hypothetical protein
MSGTANDLHDLQDRVALFGHLSFLVENVCKADAAAKCVARSQRNPPLVESFVNRRGVPKPIGDPNVLIFQQSMGSQLSA